VAVNPGDYNFIDIWLKSLITGQLVGLVPLRGIDKFSHINSKCFWSKDLTSLIRLVDYFCGAALEPRLGLSNSKFKIQNSKLGKSWRARI